MQKIHKIILTLIICGLLINLLPFKLFADGKFFGFNDDDKHYLNNTTNYWFKRIEGTQEVRSVAIGNPNSSRNVYFVSKDIDTKLTLNYGNGSSNATVNQYYNASDGFRYWYYKYNSNVNFLNNYYAEYGYEENISNQSDGYNAWYYTFGDGSAQPVSFGDLLNVGFYTKFVNSQQSNVSQMALNTDVITWDNYQDSNGNDLNDINLRVDIQAATVDFEANTKSDLLNQTINDMVTGSWSDLITISPNVGEYSFTWDTVAKALFGTNNVTVNWWNNLFNVYDSARGVFFKKGWIYRIRLRTYDDSYVGNWQIIYNVTSAPPSDSEKVYTNYYVYNYTVPDPDTYDVLQNINNINNTENNWYFNGDPFNPFVDTDNGGWLSKLLETIISLVDKILGFFSNIFDGLVDLLLGLFGNIDPSDTFFNWFSDLFNDIGDIDLTLPQFNLPNVDISSFNRLVDETMKIFSDNDLSFLIFIPLLILIIKVVF